ncbi:MAG: YraN family protein [Deferribacterales bacterium]|nr:YraN family protein [Deferribacterales bacterium]
MSNESKATGSNGENIAADYLIKNGYKILKRNFKAKTGEIDIIAYKNGVTVFVEVKNRKTLSFGYGFDAVNAKKRQKIINTAGIYCSLNGGDRQCRFDVISIDEGHVKHIENAFML